MPPRQATDAPKRSSASSRAGASRRGTMLGAPAALFVTMAALGACSQGEPQACPDDLPASCPSPAPTFSADVAPLIQSHCSGCHSPDGLEPKPLLTSYDTITGPTGSTARMVENQVGNCVMPPLGQPPLTSEERQTIVGWILCGAKND